MSIYGECNLKYSVPTKIPIAFHNGSNYNNHFDIRELAEKFKKPYFFRRKCTSLGENTEKYITFTVLMEKEVARIDENEEHITKKRSYEELMKMEKKLQKYILHITIY